MNIVLWVIQIILGLFFLSAGFTKTFKYEKAKASMPWVKEVSKGLVIFIGIAEILGGLGVILPTAIGIIPILTPIAGIGLALIMIFAAVFHFFRKEYKGIVMNIILFLLSLVVAYGRFCLEWL